MKLPDSITNVWNRARALVTRRPVSDAAHPHRKRSIAASLFLLSAVWLAVALVATAFLLTELYSRALDNSLVETLEFDNLLGQAVVTVNGALNRTESRGAHAREDFPDRDDTNWMKHTLAWLDLASGKTMIDYRPVHSYTMTNEIEPFPPKKRVY